MPRREPAIKGSTIALVTAGIVGAGILAIYLWRKRKLDTSGTVPESVVSGLDLLGSL
jgi:LPXTG-motif cell wall-anchored protein